MMLYYMQACCSLTPMTSCSLTPMTSCSLTPMTSSCMFVPFVGTEVYIQKVVRRRHNLKPMFGAMGRGKDVGIKRT